MTLKQQARDLLSYRINTELHRRPVKVSVALSDQASQENHDGDPYDTMQSAAEYVRKLEALLLKAVQADYVPLDMATCSHCEGTGLESKR